MLWVAASLSFFGFMRSGELTIPSAASYDEGSHLTFNDVAVDSLSKPSVLQVRLKASKTDPFCLRVNIYVGRTGNSLCPVSAVLHYMVARGPGPGPFFRFDDGTPLSRSWSLYTIFVVVVVNIMFLLIYCLLSFVAF